MKTRFFLLAAWLLGAAMPAKADLQFRDYEWARGDQSMHAYLVGFARGAVYTNSLVGIGGQRRLFCLPRSLRLDEDVIFSVVDAHIKKAKPRAEAFVEQLILNAFVEKYPCLN